MRRLIEKERQLEAERKKQDDVEKRYKKFISKFHELHDMAKLSDSEIIADKPKIEDYNLAVIWGSNSKDEKIILRMLSARVAEVAMMKYLRGKGYKVVDTAISQLYGSDGVVNDWIFYDVSINDDLGETYFIDVKNARRSDKNPQSYTAHCVPKFKTLNRHLDVTKSVLIAGTLSEWYLDYDNIPNSVQFLGITGQSAVKTIVVEFKNSSLEVEIELDKLGRALLPPWVFEFPRLEYLKVDELLDLFISEFDDFIKDGLYMSALIAIGLEVDLNNYKFKNESNAMFVVSMAARREKYGRRLAMIFLTILEHFTWCIKFRGEFNTGFIRSLLYCSNKMTMTPLFSYDPTMSVDSLLKTLDALWSRRNNELISITQFKLDGFNILRGKKGNNNIPGRWITLIAYCGGSDGVRKCANTPLVIGESNLCENGFLVCPKCKFCCKSHKEDQKDE